MIAALGIMSFWKYKFFIIGKNNEKQYDDKIEYQELPSLRKKSGELDLSVEKLVLAMEAYS